MSRAHSAIFTAAAALGVVGVLAFALQSVGDETPAQAESGARYRPTPDLPDPGATRSEKTHHKKANRSEASHGAGLTVSSSAEPEPLPTEKKTPSGEQDAPAGSDSAEPSRPGTATPTDRSPAGASASGSSGAPTSPDDGRIGDSGQGRAPAEPADPTGSPEEPQDEDQGSTQDDGPLKRTVDGVLGGVGSGVNGLLGN
ncbi:hypothetical protein ACFYYR_26885 [Streptomyces sp. NPDC001922]|uniref:hypothetical protein n=1 Tax=Streptomyces sp. NPDC001922 TaxID=3364624 RepID=UPI00369CD0F1